MIDILAGLDYLHTLDPPVIHADIRGVSHIFPNTLYASDGHICPTGKHRRGRRRALLSCRFWPCFIVGNNGDDDFDCTREHALVASRGIRICCRLLQTSSGHVFVCLYCRRGQATPYLWTSKTRSTYIRVQIYTGRQPFPALKNDGAVVLAVTVQKRRPDQPSEKTGMTDEIWSHVKGCFKALPSNRPSAGEILHSLRLYLNERAT